MVPCQGQRSTPQGGGGSSQRLGQPRRLLAHPGLCYDPRHGGVAVGASKPASRRPPPRSAIVTLEVILQSLVSGLLMGGVYATVLARLRLAPFTVLRKRLSLSAVEKVMVVARRALRPHFV